MLVQHYLLVYWVLMFVPLYRVGMYTFSGPPCMSLFVSTVFVYSHALLSCFSDAIELIMTCVQQWHCLSHFLINHSELRIVAKPNRHRASTSMYSLTFRVRRYTHLQCIRLYTYIHVCWHSNETRAFIVLRFIVAILLSTVNGCGLSTVLINQWLIDWLHRLQIRPIVHNSTIPPTYIRVSAVVWTCGDGQTQTDRHACPIYTFRVVYDSREIQ